jgi:hypothetical protein
MIMGVTLPIEAFVKLTADIAALASETWFTVGGIFP